MTNKVNFCAQPSCSYIAINGRFCEHHKTDNYQKRADKARRQAATEKWYDKRVWRDRLRPMKLRRNPVCEMADCNRPATDVHHVDDSWKETEDWRLFTTLENLQSLCHEHHSSITMNRNHVRETQQ